MNYKLQKCMLELQKKTVTIVTVFYFITNSYDLMIRSKYIRDRETHIHATYSSALFKTTWIKETFYCYCLKFSTLKGIIQKRIRPYTIVILSVYRHIPIIFPQPQ